MLKNFKSLSLLIISPIIFFPSCIKKNEVIMFEKECGSETTVVACYEKYNECLDSSKSIKENESTDGSTRSYEGNVESCLIVFESCETQVNRYLDCKMLLAEEKMLKPKK
jgi:hypothetical protein